MKKYLLILIIVISFPPIVKAEEINFNTGISYNNFVYKLTENGNNKDYVMREDLNSGWGYYGESVFWPNKDWGVGVGLDVAKATWDGTNHYSDGDTREFEYSSKLIGPYTTIKYKLNKSLIVNLDLVYYNYKEHFRADYSWDKETFEQDFVTGAGLGIKLGTEFNYKLNDSFYLKGKSYFRKVGLDLKEEYDDVEERMIDIKTDKNLNITGLQVALGIVYTF